MIPKIYFRLFIVIPVKALRSNRTAVGYFRTLLASYEGVRLVRLRVPVRVGDRMTNLSPEIVIVGGGVGGGALATVLARNGVEVVVLERETSYPDRVRGEFIAPWGVAEFKRLGLLDLVYARGAIQAKCSIRRELVGRICRTSGT